MRLSEWRAAAPSRDSMSSKVMGVLEPVLTALGTARDPHCWVVWGEEAATRYLVLAPTDAGLVICHVRVNLPQEGPRTAGKLVRWSRVQVGDLAIETQSGHRILSFTVEQQVLKGVDAEADRVASFARALFGAIDGGEVSFEETKPAGRAKAADSGRAAAPKPASSAASAASAAPRTARGSGASKASSRPPTG